MNGICTFVRMHSLSLSTILLMLVLTSDILSVFGELTILTVPEKKKAMCAPEDDSGALVKNYSFDLEIIEKKVTSLVENLRTTRITEREVTLEWDSPSKPNERVTEYIVLWKVVQLPACQALIGRTPEQDHSCKIVKTTTARLTKLHPFADYGVTVMIPVTPYRSESSEEIYFQTKSSATIMSVVENLRLDEDTLRWDDSMECTAITSDNCYHLKFDGVSDWVRNATGSTYRTIAPNFELENLKHFHRAATRYKVRVCVATKWDIDCKGRPYKELNFTTKPQGGDEGSKIIWLVAAAVVTIAVIVTLSINIVQRKRRGTPPPPESDYAIPILRRYPHLNQKQYERDTESGIQYLSSPTFPEVSSPTMNTGDANDYIYDTPVENEYTHVVIVKYFECFVKRAFASGMLEKQFATFPKGQTKSCIYGSLPDNRRKNRYIDIIAYDETRVKLRELSEVTYSVPYSDYINADYIDGYNKEKAYIATQGPLPNTVIDFWQMIWQEKSLVICMLVNVTESLQTKCEQYWPELGTRKTYGEVTVWNVSQSVFADYTYRTFEISFDQETRQIRHLHYTAWPELGEPVHAHSVVAYLKKLLDTPRGNGPVVVHCSSGVGRTGTIILCDICLQGAAVDVAIYMFAEAKSIRGQRVNMIANKEQYFLAHVAVAECLSAPSTAIPYSDGWPKKIKEMKKQLSVQRQRLSYISWHDHMLQFTNINVPLSKRCLEKNRFPELAPGRMNSVYLSRYPIDDVDSDYVSALHVDGVTRRNQYLASQLPLPTTIADFWRLVAKLKIELVLILQDPNLRDATCCEVMPQIEEIEPVPHITVKSITETDFKHFSSQKLVLTDSSETPRRTQPVTILTCKGWQPGRNAKPPSAKALLSLWTASEEISRGEGPTIVLCYDGITGCGLYLALSYLLERMVIERECDVYSAVRAVRRSRPQFVQTLEQFGYLYNAAAIYSESLGKTVTFD